MSRKYARLQTLNFAGMVLISVSRGKRNSFSRPGLIWIFLWQVLQTQWRRSGSNSGIVVCDGTEWKAFLSCCDREVWLRLSRKSTRPVLLGVLILPFLHSKDPCDQRAEEKSGGIPHLVNTRQSYIITTSGQTSAELYRLSLDQQKHHESHSWTCIFYHFSFRVVIMKTNHCGQSGRDMTSASLFCPRMNCLNLKSFRFTRRNISMFQFAASDYWSCFSCNFSCTLSTLHLTYRLQSIFYFIHGWSNSGCCNTLQ